MSHRIAIRHRRDAPGGTPVTVTLLVVAYALVLATAVPASGDEAGPLLGTMPADNGELDHPPEVARAAFGREVEPVGEGVVVRDADGRRVDTGRVDPPPSAAVVEAGLPADLPAGTYQATWRIRGDDGEPVEGSWHFTVLDDGDGSTAPSRAPWLLLAVVVLGLAGAGLWRVSRRSG